ncbi:MAG: hypothetical protein WAO02_13575 [Verrucomicrobiia bacterium]
MDKKQLERYRLALLAERGAKLASVHLQYDKKLKALDVLLDRDESPEVGQAEFIPNGTPAKSLLQAVREAIRETSGLMDGMSGKFSSVTLFKFISNKYPDYAKKPSDLSNPLWKLKKDGEIEVMQQGSGQNPSIYQKTNRFNAA